MLRVLFVWMVVVLAACGGEDVATNGAVDATNGEVDILRVDTVAVVDSLIDGPVEDALVGDAEGEGPDAGDAPTVDDAPPPIEQPQREQPDPQEGAEAPAPDEAGPPPLAARYQLATVEGESLPVTIGLGEECELQLANGNLRIQQNMDFEIRTTIQEVCAGERASEDVHTAEGTVSRDGMQLTFEARYDSLFATAYGRHLPEGHIVIETLETEGGEQDVEWRFLR